MAARKSIAERFWSKVDKRGPNECWPWLGAQSGPGYGSLKVAGHKEYAHRIAWELRHGMPVPKGMSVLHHCDWGLCCHAERCLFLGTDADNAADRNAKGRQARGERHANSKLSAERVLEIRAKAAQGENQRALAVASGLNLSTVRAIVKRRSWRHLPDDPGS